MSRSLGRIALYEVECIAIQGAALRIRIPSSVEDCNRTPGRLEIHDANMFDNSPFVRVNRGMLGYMNWRVNCIMTVWTNSAIVFGGKLNNVRRVYAEGNTD